MHSRTLTVTPTGRSHPDRVIREGPGPGMLRSVSTSDVVDAHRAAGTAFLSGGVTSFVRTAGDGPPVVCMHGLPASSFLYRRVLPELAARDLRGVAFDLPGLGLADRPDGFDYRIRGLGRWAAGALDSLGIDRYHLVLHDAGGPVGLEMALVDPGRVLSVTVLDTPLALAKLPFRGELYARVAHHMVGPMASRAAWRRVMYRVGIDDRAAVPAAEVDAYRDLCLGDDGGKGYLDIMRVVRDEPMRTDAFRAILDSRHVHHPVRILWGMGDPILTVRHFGRVALDVTGLPSLTTMPGRHFLQEDRAPQVAEFVAATAALAE